MVEWNKTGQEGGGTVCTQIGGFNFVVNAVRSYGRVSCRRGHDLIYVFQRPSAAVWGLRGRRETN